MKLPVVIALTFATIAAPCAAEQSFELLRTKSIYAASPAGESAQIPTTIGVLKTSDEQSSNVESKNPSRGFRLLSVRPTASLFKSIELTGSVTGFLKNPGASIGFTARW